MLINDYPRCGRCKYWKAMRCTNRESRLYKFEQFQHANGKCDLWEDGSDFFNNEDESEQKEREP